MKWMSFIFAVASVCIASANAQPTSIAGIIPGKTTLGEDLIELVTDVGDIDMVRNSQPVRLKELNGKKATVYFNKGLIYKVTLLLHAFPENKFLMIDEQTIREALFEKYGVPDIKDGSIREIICRNKLGASFRRIEGEERLLWKPNAGIQAYIRRWALRGECAEDFWEEYVIEHIETVQALESERAAKQSKERDERINKAMKGL